MITYNSCCAIAIAAIGVLSYNYITTGSVLRFFPISPTFELASINFTHAKLNHKEVSKKMVKVLHDIGFAALTEVDDYDPEELLKWTKWFFDLPKERKMKVAKKAFNNENANIYRGYFPLILDGHSYKEAFEMGIFSWNENINGHPKDSDIRNTTKNEKGREYRRNIVKEKNAWPLSDISKQEERFKAVMQKYNSFFLKVAKETFRLIVHGLGYEKSMFDQMCGKDSLSTFRLIHYPSRLLNSPETIPAEARDNGKIIATGEHFDTSLLTILFTFNFKGLQIKPVGFDNWMDISAVRNNTLLVNVGALLESLSNKQVVATNHRVLDIGEDRYSVVLFFEPHYDADLSKTFSGQTNNEIGKYKKYGPWMTNRTSMFAEYRSTDFGVDD